VRLQEFGLQSDNLENSQQNHHLRDYSRNSNFMSLHSIERRPFLNGGNVEHGVGHSFSRSPVQSLSLRWFHEGSGTEMDGVSNIW